MITILDERTFKISSDTLIFNTKLKKIDILKCVEDILDGNSEMPITMELKFVY